MNKHEALRDFECCCCFFALMFLPIMPIRTGSILCVSDGLFQLHKRLTKSKLVVRTVSKNLLIKSLMDNKQRDYASRLWEMLG